jgi:hypothetical protein
VPFSCQDSGPMWPDVARCLPAVAPNLAPSKLISSANDTGARTKSRPAYSPRRVIADPSRRSHWRSAIRRRTGFPDAARPDAARGAHNTPARAR